MPRNPFKVPALAKMFDVCLSVAADNFSEFYIVTARSGGFGPNAPRRGASHRHAFWNGYHGAGPCTVDGSLSRAAYRAGQAFQALRKEDPLMPRAASPERNTRSAAVRKIRNLMHQIGLVDAGQRIRSQQATRPSKVGAAAVELLSDDSFIRDLLAEVSPAWPRDAVAGFIVTLETRNFSFEAHGITEEQANEAMGRALTRHEQQYTLPAEWWQDYEFQTRPFLPGLAFRDGESL